MAAYAFDHLSRGLSRFERQSQNLRIHAEVFDGGQATGIEGNQGNRSALLKAIVGRELREMMTFLKKKKEVGVPQELAASK